MHLRVLALTALSHGGTWAQNVPALQSVQVARGGPAADPTAEVCATLTADAAQVMFNDKSICQLKECSKKGVTLACDEFPISIEIPAVTTITDTLSFNAVLNLCPGAGKPVSIVLDFKDAGLAATGVTKADATKWNQKFTSDQQIPVSIPIAVVPPVTVTAVATVIITPNPANLRATIDLDICASVSTGGLLPDVKYCGVDLLPASLPVRLGCNVLAAAMKTARACRFSHFKRFKAAHSCAQIVFLDETLDLTTFCETPKPPPPPTPPAPTPGPPAPPSPTPPAPTPGPPAPPSPTPPTPPGPNGSTKPGVGQAPTKTWIEGIPNVALVVVAGMRPASP